MARTGQLGPLHFMALCCALLAPGCANFTQQASESVLAPLPGHRLKPSDFGLRFEAATLPVGDGDRLAIWNIQPPVGAGGDGRTVLLSCPADGNMGDLHPWWRFLTAGGWRVICWDPRGYGESTGTPNLTANVRDVVRVQRWALEQPGVTVETMVSYGVGLGSGMATALLVNDRRVPAAVCDGIVSAAQQAGLPTLAITQDVDVENNLPRIQQPVLLIQGLDAPQDNRWALERAHRYDDHPKADLWELPACGNPPSPLLAHDGVFQPAVLAWMHAAVAGDREARTVEASWDKARSELAWSARAWAELAERRAALQKSLEPGELPDVMPARQLAYQIQLRLGERNFSADGHAAFAATYLGVARALLRSNAEEDQAAAPQWLLIAAEAEPTDPERFLWSTSDGRIQRGWPHADAVAEARRLLEEL